MFVFDLLFFVDLVFVFLLDFLFELLLFLLFFTEVVSSLSLSLTVLFEVFFLVLFFVVFFTVLVVLVLEAAVFFFSRGQAFGADEAGHCPARAEEKCIGRSK